MKKGDKGYSLLEVTIALALWMILSAGIFLLWRHTATTGAALIARQNAFENARSTMDALIMNIQMSQNITLRTDGNNSLRSLELVERNPVGQLHVYTFEFNVNLPPGDLRFQRLDFGSQEFSSNIADIRIIYIEGSRMQITVITGCEEPIVLEGSVDVRFKNISVNPSHNVF